MNRTSAGRGADRRAQILEAARDIFLERGYAGASTDAIVVRSGGSKETVYAHFENKAGLFRAVVSKEIDDLFVAIERHAGDPADDLLRNVGRSVISVIFSEEALRLARILVAEGDRIPGLGSQFFEAGPRRVRQSIAEALSELQRRGALPQGDAAALAATYLDLLLGEYYIRALIEPDYRPSASELDARAERAAETVLKLSRLQT